MLRCRGFTVSISVAFISGNAMCKSFVINMVIKSVVVVVFVDRI